MSANKDKAAETPVIVERTLNAPVSKIWKALTEDEHIKGWFFDIKGFKPQAGFEFQFSAEKDGIQYSHLCKVTDAAVDKRLAYSWCYDGYKGNSLVTFELFSEGDNTRLKLTHEGLETFPKTPDFARENFSQGWAMIIGENLKAYVSRNF